MWLKWMEEPRDWRTVGKCAAFSSGCERSIDMTLQTGLVCLVTYYRPCVWAKEVQCV